MAKGRPTVDHACLRRATSSDVDNSVGQNGTPSRVRREAATPGRFEDLSLLLYVLLPVSCIWALHDRC